MSTRLNERSNPTGLLFSFVGGATLSSNRALRALRAQQDPVRIRHSFVGANCVRPRAFKERPYGQIKILLISCYSPQSVL